MIVGNLIFMNLNFEKNIFFRYYFIFKCSIDYWTVDTKHYHISKSYNLLFYHRYIYITIKNNKNLHCINL